MELKGSPGVRAAGAFRCGVCNLITRVRVPKGDARRIVATVHFVGTERCPGSSQNAYEVAK